MKQCQSNDAPGMAGCRSRNTGNHRLRAKREDTHVETVEKLYGIDLGMRSDAHLGSALKRYNVPSLNKLLQVARRRKP
jgi:hypothetical protein